MMQCGHNSLFETPEQKPEFKEFTVGFSEAGNIFPVELKPGEKRYSYAEIRRAARKARQF